MRYNERYRWRCDDGNYSSGCLADRRKQLLQLRFKFDKLQKMFRNSEDGVLQEIMGGFSDELTDITRKMRELEEKAITARRLRGRAPQVYEWPGRRGESRLEGS